MESAWNVLTVKHQHEFRVGEHLERSGIPRLVPGYRARRVWSDRVREIRLPLFGGYVFANFGPESRPAVWRIPGVTGAVRFAGELASLAPEDVANLERLAATAAGYPWPALAAGRRVRIVAGPLCGVRGVLTEEAGAGDATVVVNVAMLGRAVAVSVARDVVAPYEGAPCPA